ncbi:ArsR/SmtB family transcription factor [Rhizohabitans arisaemae]|uniref:ArsR/SmtB family transcription factor n=1 Tax=Rhizohabitans arisaemae TaxID=2720610 RepID=UPI0024B1D8A9|nr:metalloregulator ArsR/SmtB family transcription factor [Rhizohabitans arisaemae]
MLDHRPHAERAEIRGTTVTAAEAARLAELFRLLGDPTRARLLYALLEAGELCVCDLVAMVEVTDTAVSHALRLLRTAKIVASRRSGRMIYYRLADSHVRMLLELSREHLWHLSPNPRM